MDDVDRRVIESLKKGELSKLSLWIKSFARENQPLFFKRIRRLEKEKIITIKILKEGLRKKYLIKLR